MTELKPEKEILDHFDAMFDVHLRDYSERKMSLNDLDSLLS